MLVLLAGTIPGRAAAQTIEALESRRYEVDPQHSSVAFAAKLMGVVKVRGRFTDYQATLLYDAAQPERSSVTAVINAKSINTDMEFRDNHLRTPDFFDVAQFPTIVFQSRAVVRRKGQLVVTGPLTMHGVTREVSIPFDVILAPTEIPASGMVRTGFQGFLRLNRQEFGIAGTNRFNPSFNPATSLIGDSVDVELDLYASRNGYRNWTFAGRTPPSIADTVARTLDARGVAEALRVYQAVKAAQPAAFTFSPGQLDALGHVLMFRNRVADAVAILKFNADLFPAVPGVFESLAEAYSLAGDRAGAAAAYDRALQVDSSSSSAREMLRHLRPD